MDIDFDFIDSGGLIDMASSELIFTVSYVLVGMCLVIPPTEFVSAGLTVQNLLSNFLGSEHLNFLHYHMKRTAATLIIHSCIPLGIEIIDQQWALYSCIEDSLAKCGRGIRITGVPVQGTKQHRGEATECQTWRYIVRFPFPYISV